MRHGREILTWTLIGSASLVVLICVFRLSFPFFSPDWTLTRSEAQAIALERLRDLGEPVEDPYVVIEFRSALGIERQLQMHDGEFDRQAFHQSQLSRSMVLWDVLIFKPGALANEWTYRCRISRTGEVLGLLKQISDSDGSTEEIDETTARQRAAEYLTQEGFDLDTFFPEPTIQRLEDDQTKELRVRYHWREQLLGEEYPYGLEVSFAGPELTGFNFWFDEPNPDELQAFFRQLESIGLFRFFLIYLLLPFVIVPFLKRYHDGQLGVRRGVHFFLLFWGGGILFLALCGREIASSASFGLMTRHQTTWLVGLATLIFYLSANGVMALMSWAVGESFCRQVWPQKLASIDAFFRGKWTNATVARSALRGLAGGSAMAALAVAANLPLRTFGVWTMSGTLFDNVLSSSLPGLSLLTGQLSFSLPIYLLACFLVPCWLGARLGTIKGLIPAWLLASIILNPFALAVPMPWGFLVWLLVAAIPVLIFRFGDLLSALLAGLTAPILIDVQPLIQADDPFLQLNGWGALLVIAAPLLVSLRWLGSDQKFLYTYDDIPAHVRRITERERQRVELETAARIQTSILPQLPPQLNGIDVAYTYLPASEVGGDFYDVLALEDGRVAVAVGDVAGHGVSSGLVMSMAKSALAVQVTFDPEVESVLHTLNRMVYQSARQRLLTTLCYAIIDPRIHQLHYASAGHLYPYLVSPGGRVAALEDSSYPLGVRDQISVRSHVAKLEPGDAIFLYSDGLVEARPENSDELFGFDRLESSLERHAGKSPQDMRDSVLADVETFAGHNRQDDDLTVLVLRLPAA